jgi:hypothetical protein
MISDLKQFYSNQETLIQIDDTDNLSVVYQQQQMVVIDSISETFGY